MNGYDIYEKAVLRLGYKRMGESDIVDTRLSERSLEFINQIAEDLKLKQIENLSQEINIGLPYTEALCCGLAMLLSLSEGDTNKNIIFTALYNAKRAAALCEGDTVEDTLPTTEG